jgi:hypothetical protein
VESLAIHTPDSQERSTVSTQQHYKKQDQAPIPVPQPQPKRRKIENKAQKTNTATESIPEWESARPQWEQELGDSHARQQMNDIVQRPWATVNDNMGLNGINIIRTIPQEQRNSMGWSAVNQPTLPPTPTPQSFNSVSENNSSFRQSKEHAKRDDSIVHEDGGVALIDTLPKSKQRQVYGLVSGLQNGIQGLQRELDSLKRALGIDED